MSNIHNIDFSLYSLYAFTNQVSPFKLELRIDSGYVEYTSYDSFETDSGTIICFKKNSHDGFHDIKITGDRTDYIQLTSGEGVMDRVFNEKQMSGYNFYLFMDSIIQNQPYMFDDSWNLEHLRLPEDFSRCDYKKFGADAFYKADNGYNVTDVFYVLGVTGIGHIIKVQTSNEENLNPQSQVQYTAGRTLAGVLKSIYEWTVVAKEPFNNNEKVANSATEFLQSLNLSDDVIADIVSGTGDMSLARYIRGDMERTPEREIQSMYDMPESFKEYIKHHFSYTSLYELNNSLNLNIFDTELTQKYRQYLENKIVGFYYKIGVDPEDFSSFEELLSLDVSTTYVKNIISKYMKIND